MSHDPNRAAPPTRTEESPSPPAAPPLQSLQPSPVADRRARRRLPLQGELLLALLPTAVVLGVFAFVEVFSRQRLLFASLASSAFLIYLDPRHGTNSFRTLVLSQSSAAILGFGLYELLDNAYLSGAAAMIATIFLMIVLDVVHPPAVSTSLAFAFRGEDEQNLVLFLLAVLLVLALIVLQQASMRLTVMLDRRGREKSSERRAGS